MTNPTFSASLKPFLLLLVASFSLSCTTIQSLTNLKKVDFAIDRVSDTVLNGVAIDDISSFDKLGPSDALKILQGVTTKSLPLSMIINVEGDNPAENNVVAKLVKMDWTLFLEGKETVSGSFNEVIEFVPGAKTNIPVDVEVDLYSFFSSNARELFNIATSIAGVGNSEPTEIYLKARPTISTAIGPITYPRDVTILKKTIG